MSFRCSLTPAEAWQPLPDSAWDEAAARHLLGRIGWAARDETEGEAVAAGLPHTLRGRLLRMPLFPKPPGIAALEASAPEAPRRAARGQGAEPRAAARAARERSREAAADLTIRWLQHAARPEHAAAEKWLLFLQDVWVVTLAKVKAAPFLFQHQDWLRRGALGSYRDLAKYLSRSPAMIEFLDLQRSRPEAPNENFARELLELFTLGEGHYTEADIKEAARAFTGYRQQGGEFRFVRRLHDPGIKSVFGQSGRFGGDDVIDLVFQQPAAGRFLVREMARFYLTDEPLPEAYLAPLGDWWARQDFSLAKLLPAFFGSRLFFAPEFRGNFIKSPVHFYLGLVQDLDLAPAPLPRRVIGALRQMGQMPYNAPNVRGWIGGRTWINSATLAARRAVVADLLTPMDPALLNGDERQALAAADPGLQYSLSLERLDAWARLPPADAAAALIRLALPARAGDPVLRGQVVACIEGSPPGARRQAVRAALGALFEAPDYQLC